MGDLALGWQSPVSEIVHPRHINLTARGGLGWLEGFTEWLARCGLENTGQAGQDEIINNVGDKQTVDLTLHGKIANIPASEVEIIVEKKAPYRITVRGLMSEKMLFGPKLDLFTEVSTEPGSNQFRIQDVVVNRGTQPQEYQILYHYNFGPPLLGEGAKLHVPVEKVTPYNANAAKAVKTWNSFAAPAPGYVEQVYLLRPLEDKAGPPSMSCLHNPKADARGVVWPHAKEGLPRPICRSGRTRAPWKTATSSASSRALASRTCARSNARPGACRNWTAAPNIQCVWISRCSTGPKASSRRSGKSMRCRKNRRRSSTRRQATLAYEPAAQARACRGPLLGLGLCREPGHDPDADPGRLCRRAKSIAIPG